jgi:ankyrin repeat protein
MEFKNVVFNAARDGKLRRLKVFLDHRPREEVSQLVGAKTNGATPLVLSCRNGHQDVVEYLVDRCLANVEQAGSVTFDGETIEGAPPLWCGAAAGHLEIVKLLCKSGANVNSTTKTNSTPLRAACFDGHFEIVKYLVERNADIEVANRHGHTCLMIACYKGHYKIAKFLIDIGADVNRKSVKGNTALHDCAESGSLDIMKLLLNSGARIDVDAYGMTPLLAASVTGHLHIVEHLIQQRDLVGKQERIDALELLGATYVDKKRDMLGAFKLWKRGMEERYDDGVLVIPKALVSSPISAYENTLEVESVAALEEIISDPDGMRMQALLVRERILGPAHPDTSYYIRYRGAVYADMGHFERCITLWMYALDMQQKILEPLSPMTQSSLLSFAELFSFMMSEGGRTRGQLPGFPNLDGGNLNPPAAPAPPEAPAEPAPVAAAEALPPVGVEERAVSRSAGTSPPPVNFCDIMTVFRRAVREVKAGQAGDSRATGDSTYFNRTLVIILHLVCLLTRLLPHLDEEQVYTVKKAVYEFLAVGARGRGGSTPLHLACSRDSSSVGRYPICMFPSIQAVDLLLECGADPNGKDFEGNTPLHVSVTNKPVKPAVIQSLLDHGGHFDLVNNNKRPFASLLKGQPLHEVVNSVRHTSLSCLAARVVRRYQLPRDQLPLTLQKFVEEH